MMLKMMLKRRAAVEVVVNHRLTKVGRVQIVAKVIVTVILNLKNLDSMMKILMAQRKLKMKIKMKTRMKKKKTIDFNLS